MDWLKPLVQMFYAPGRALGAVRDRAPLGAAAVAALLAQVALTLYSEWAFLAPSFMHAGAFAAFGLLRDAAGTLFLLALAFVPALILFANLFERRGSFRLVLQQEYAPLASAIFYAWTAAHLVALPLLWLLRRSGAEAANIAQNRQLWQTFGEQHNLPPDMLTAVLDPRLHTEVFARMLVLPFFFL